MPNHNGLAMLYTKFALMIYLMKAINGAQKCSEDIHMTHSQMFQKVESGGGPIFNEVLEC